MRGPPITVRCDCGEIAYLPYGERWQCPQCNRKWDTNQIPSEEYWGIIREMRRYRLNVITAALVMAAVMLVLGRFLGARVFPLGIVLAGVFSIFYMPRWRRRVRVRARSLPTWQLRPE
ncbi:MAG TPA: hypothetical protein VFF07_09135 [Actinomycetota bacterium]|nr:hypothetical protein [Actinomycetota bacterium]